VQTFAGHMKTLAEVMQRIPVSTAGVSKGTVVFGIGVL
jgi:hypothetical protein